MNIQLIIKVDGALIGAKVKVDQDGSLCRLHAAHTVDQDYVLTPGKYGLHSFSCPEGLLNYQAEALVAYAQSLIA